MTEVLLEAEQTVIAPDERLASLRKRIARCRKVLARLHDAYLAEMRSAQTHKEGVSAKRRAALGHRSRS